MRFWPSLNLIPENMEFHPENKFKSRQGTNKDISEKDVV